VCVCVCVCLCVCVCVSVCVCVCVDCVCVCVCVTLNRRSRCEKCSSSCHSSFVLFAVCFAPRLICKIQNVYLEICHVTLQAMRVEYSMEHSQKEKEHNLKRERERERVRSQLTTPLHRVGAKEIHWKIPMYIVHIMLSDRWTAEKKGTTR